MNWEIRLATPEDGEALQAIYAPYVEHTAITFEVEAPDAGEFADRIRCIAGEYPYLVCCAGGRAVGYAYAAKHQERAAYAYDVNTSIYLAPAYRAKGIGARLYACLFDLLRAQGLRNAYAAYTVPNARSARFHEKQGFRVVGTFHKTGYKLGRWHDVTWVEKALSDYSAPMSLPRRMDDLPKQVVESILQRYNAPAGASV